MNKMVSPMQGFGMVNAVITATLSGILVVVSLFLAGRGVFQREPPECDQCNAMKKDTYIALALALLFAIGSALMVYVSRDKTASEVYGWVTIFDNALRFLTAR
jgi:ABC-type Mn2+/Zn2+ transport system permease subunit